MKYKVVRELTIMSQEMSLKATATAWTTKLVNQRGEVDGLSLQKLTKAK